MTNMGKKVLNSYRKPRIGEFVAFLAQEYHLDQNDVADKLLSRFPELHNKRECSNCRASMVEYVYTPNFPMTNLLLAMSREVRENTNRKGMKFTDANKVHIQELPISYTARSYTTQARVLGLIAKVLKKDHTGAMVHDQKAGWIITSRGWDYISGKPVPKYVKVFRNEIEERFEETTTIGEVLYGKKGAKELGYDPKEWIEYAHYIEAGLHQPNLL